MTGPIEVGQAGLPDLDSHQHLRILEAVLFAAAEPLALHDLASRLPDRANVAALLDRLRSDYARRGVNVVEVGGRWALRTAPDLGGLLRLETEAPRRLSRAATETLAIIAYHQPVTRAEIEEIRGVALSRGTLDMLMEAGWIRPGGRRAAPGRPVIWTTTTGFLSHFGLTSLEDLPGLEDLKAAGLLDVRPGLSSYGARAEADDHAPEDTDSSTSGAQAELPLDPGEDLDGIFGP